MNNFFFILELHKCSSRSKRKFIGWLVCFSQYALHRNQKINMNSLPKLNLNQLLKLENSWSVVEPRLRNLSHKNFQSLITWINIQFNGTYNVAELEIFWKIVSVAAFFFVDSCLLTFTRLHSTEFDLQFMIDAIDPFIDYFLLNTSSTEVHYNIFLHNSLIRQYQLIFFTKSIWIIIWKSRNRVYDTISDAEDANQ